ncbi:MAG: Ldh family oxidoreductase [Candidatus Aminicenantes bacterium]|nr:Ldh family oxidoreductase [Candidatus Aminicenantes bacterium]
MQEWISVKIDDLFETVVEVFEKLGVPKEDGKIIADVLISADRRGIDSHGVARLKRYVDGIRNGVMNPKTEITVVKETPVSMVVDGGAGMGQVVAYRVMKKCIEKAKKNYLCFATIRNSNHYGIAGYYSMMALKEGLIGISMTNAAPLVIPTFGKDAVLGTNPISVAVPAKNEKPFVLDMATSTVPRGKLEVYNRLGKKIPLMWATDENGVPTDDPARVLRNLLERKGGGLLPLGGADELTGGHKGYGLALLVDIFSGVFSSGAWGTDVYGKKGQPANVCHFLGAISPDAFIGLEGISENMDNIIRMLKNAPKAEGKDRIYIHGEKEFEKEKERNEEVPLYYKVYDTIKYICNELGVEFKL